MSRLMALVMRTLSLLFRNVPLRIRNGPARGLRRRFGQGFKPKFGLTAEEVYLEGLDLSGKTVFDVGAYVGIMTLFFARAVGKSGKVVAFEPNPENQRELAGNVRLNGFENVAILPFGIGDRTGTAELTLDPIYPSRGSLLPGEGSTVAVEIRSLDELLGAGELPVPDFVKIDVEGLEDQVISGMRNLLVDARPELFVELHGGASDVLLGQLFGAGYRLHHVETQADWTAEALATTRGGHLHCKVG